MAVDPVTPLSVSSNYSVWETSKTAPASVAPAAATSSSSPSFEDYISDAARGVVDSLHNAEQVSKEALMGKASVQEVVTAIMVAETNLQTVVSLRDKMIQSYQEILRMPV